MAEEVVVPPIPNTPQPPAGEPQRPTWLPEKFKSPEQLAQAYSELETKLGQPAPAPAPAPAPGTPVPLPTISAEEDPLAVFEEEFRSTGSLSEKSYADLAKKGYPKRVVDNYIEGTKARAQQEAATLYGMVGGQEVFQTMATWAAANLQESEIELMNAGFTKGGAQAQIALRALQQAYQSHNGMTPSLLDPTGAGGSIGDSYESYEALMSDMRKDEYKFDPAFRKKVEEKLARSQL